MTRLLLNVNQPYAYGYMETGASVTLRRLSDADGRPIPWWTSRRSVDIGGGTNAERDTAFDLPGGGHYSINVITPRAAELEREVFVNEGEERREQIVLDGSPHEYLAWQQFAGIVVPTESFSTVGFAFAPPPEPLLFRADVPVGLLAWTAASHSGMIATAPAPLLRLDQDSAFTMWSAQPPPASDTFQLIARLRQAKEMTAGDPLRTKYPRWLTVGVPGAAPQSLVSIPWEWWGADSSADDGLRIVHTRGPLALFDAPGKIETVVSVLDRRWFALLEFLSSNRLGAVADIMDEVLLRDGPNGPLEALYGKRKGPIVAVAGALTFVIRAKSSIREPWDDWLENLANWFPGIPDGPIILAFRQLAQAHSRDDLQRAFQWLETGIARGIPFFSATLQMLVQSLSQLAGDLPDAEVARRFVARISSRVDPNQPFTVIRL